MLFLLYLQHRLSSVSVVFDFNASLIDVALAYPILLSVGLIKKGKGLLFMSDICEVFVCINIANGVKRVQCLISVHHPVMLLLFLQSCSLLI